MKPPTPSSAFDPVAAGALPNLGLFDYEATAARQTETRHTVLEEAARRTVRPVLVIIEGTDAGRVVAIERDQIIIGRGTECGLVLPDTGVSRRHARVVVIDGGFVLEDLDSKNGTLVDGKFVSSQPLPVGEVFHVGANVRIRLSLMDASEERLARSLYESSMRDPLTGTFNRRYLFQRLSAELAFGARHHVPVSLVMIDIDHFKSVNDRLGHAVGDRILGHVARLIGRGLRSEDVLARIGGEEFVVLLRNTAEAAAMTVAERITSGVATTPLVEGDETVEVTVSAGVGDSRELGPGAAPEALLALADQRLYAAKAAGRNCVRGA